MNPQNKSSRLKNNPSTKLKNNLDYIIVPGTVCIILIVIMTIFSFALVHSSFLNSAYSGYMKKDKKEDISSLRIEQILDKEKIKTELEAGLTPGGKSTLFEEKKEN